MVINVKQNAKRNIVFGFFNKFILLLLPFISRSFISRYLGVNFLGLNSLFSSIIHVLLLSEMGFSSALVYHMYRPIAENDQDTINALLNLYRKAYIVIGTVIIIIGLMLIPVLPRLIKGDYPADTNITVIYIIQLMNTAVSYFLFGYKQSLLTAYQREDVNSVINLVVQSVLHIAQILLLVRTRSYYVYVICMPIATVINNVWIAIATKRMFPDARCCGHLTESTLSDIKKLVAGTFIQKACATTRNSLDSICISSFIGLTITGIYNNYYTVMSGLTTLVTIIGASLSGGIGNHVATKSSDENFEELRRIDFLYMGISGWGTVCLLCTFQTFMQLWMGEDMMLTTSIVVLLCLYFYLLKMGDMRSLYSAANGLWWKMRYRSIAETSCNVLLNITLGLIWGIYGIVVATIISLFICNFIWSSSILFSNYFGKQKLRDYFKYHFRYFVFTAAMCCISYFLCSLVHIDNLLTAFIVKGVICTILFAFCFMLTYSRNKIFRESIRMVVDNA